MSLLDDIRTRGAAIRERLWDLLERHAYPDDTRSTWVAGSMAVALEHHVVARVQSLCDMQVVMQVFEDHFGKPLSAADDNLYVVFNLAEYRVVVVVGPPEGRPWATDIYFVSKKTTFSKAEAQDITRIMSELPGTYFKENSATQIHFGLQSVEKAFNLQNIY